MMHPVERSPKRYDLALLFAALSDRTRLRLLHLMQRREVCVCYFVAILGQSQPKISRHLASLRRAGVVAARREGKWMHYRIVFPLPPAQPEFCGKPWRRCVTTSRCRPTWPDWNEPAAPRKG